MFFSFLKPQKHVESKLDKYNSFNYAKHFPKGLIIQTPEKDRYVINSGGFLTVQNWRLVEEDSKEERGITPKRAKFEFIESNLEHLVNGEIAAIGTLPSEIGEEIDENIASTIGESSKRRMNHYYDLTAIILEQFGQAPTISSSSALIILYSEKAAIENKRLGIYFSDKKWQLINSEP